MCLNWMHHVEIMCNRTKAMLKALQLLGNSFTGKQKTLIKKLQTVQNEAVRIMTRMFQMMPHDPLHQLMTIYPMKIRLNLLVQNTALHLYRALRGKETQLPTPVNNNANTMLRMLAAQVPAGSPCIKQFPKTPEDGPTWNDQVQTTPKQPDWDYQKVDETLTWLCREGSLINIYQDRKEKSHLEHVLGQIVLELDTHL
ncbi:hypothetical protein BJV74DRAFT_795450 [Russula compacta]|nr:hypothetical protein BJV74DRAFT_795450 [Russula compacta]